MQKKVIGVEIISEAVDAAKINAGINGLDNCEFIADDVLNALDNIKDKPDFIVLDPPRDGINPKALKKIIDYGVDSMVYISCKPTSLARDLVMLQESGYEVKKGLLYRYVSKYWPYRNNSGTTSDGFVSKLDSHFLQEICLALNNITFN